jgi:moderate conductance mechanosensitive channel
MFAMLVAMTRPGRCLLAVLPVLLCWIGIAAAQTAPASPPASPPPAASPPAASPPNAADLEQLLGTLQNDQQRQALIKQLQALIAVQKQGAVPAPVEAADLIDQATAQLQQVGDDLASTANVLVDLPNIAAWFEQPFQDDHSRRVLFGVARHAGLIIGPAILADLIVGFLIRRPRRRAAQAGAASRVGRVVQLLALLVIDALPILAFTLTGYFMTPFVQPGIITAHVASIVLSTIFTANVLLLIGRALVLNPRAAGWTLLPLGEESANYLFIWVRRFVIWSVYGFSAGDALWWLGVPGSIQTVLLKIVALILAVLGIVFVLQNRQAVADWLRPRSPTPIHTLGEDEAVPPDPMPEPMPGRSPPPRRTLALHIVRQRLADIWHILAITYIGGAFAVYALKVENGFAYLARGTLLSVLILSVAQLATRLINRVSERGFAIGAELNARFPTLQHRANRYLPIFNIATSSVIWLLAALALLESWGVSSFAWLASDAGRRVVGALIAIGTILVIAFVLWEVFNAAIDRYLAGIGVNGDRVARSARMRTLLPLLRNVVWVLMIMVIGLVILSELGVNIAPLLGISAVAGVAIGFGSQALVKDIITGLFILVEDTMAVGDVVDFGGGYAGAVEGMSIRTIRLRDAHGTLQVIPFGEVAKIKNLSRDFAYHVIDLTLPYGIDLDKVYAILTTIGAEMQKDDKIGSKLAGPLEIVGLTAVGLDGIKLQARIKTRALQQWAVQSEFNARLLRAFGAAGIAAPGAGQTINFDPKLVELLERFRPGELAPAMRAVAEGKR